jgi:hypothetical protein
MTIIGNSSLWAGTFPDYLIPQILDLVVTAWSNFAKPEKNEHEVPITKKFRACLRQHRDLVKLPVKIDREIPEDDLQTGEEKGRIDLLFTSAERIREDVYFAFECKKLNKIDSKNKTNSLAREYVKEGMMRFVTGKYSSSVNNGGMIGYVMDGNTDTAIGAVNRNINHNRIHLRISNSNSLLPSSLIPSNSEIKETQHDLDGRNFMIHHLFLPITSNK